MQQTNLSENYTFQYLLKIFYFTYIIIFIGAGKSKKQTAEEMKESHRQWLIDAALRLLCVLAIDRFGDFISDQVVAPVRETCAQALGSLAMLISKEKHNMVLKKDNDEPNNENHTLNEKNTNEYFLNDLKKLVLLLLEFLKHTEWEARHGALLALKYILIVRNDLLVHVLPLAFPAIMQCLSDPVDDVGSVAASALIPVAYDLPKILNAEQLESIVCRLWELLKKQDDLTAACNSFMGLLAAILSLSSARILLTPQPLSMVSNNI